MKLTIEWLNEVGACKAAIDWFKTQPKTDLMELIADSIRDQERLDWANWALTRCLTKKNKIRYAVYAAEQVLDIFEKRYDSDKPRKAILAAKEVLKNPSKENRDAAAAAYAAYYAAYYAADAAAAAYAADAYAAARARTEMQCKILEYGIGLLNEQSNV